MRISDWSSDVCSSDLSTTAGWHDARIGPREPLTIDTATAVLHYAQEIFEGLKAYRLADGGTALFRPDRNAARFRDSARRMAMAELPEELFLESIRRLVQTGKDWIPTLDGGRSEERRVGKACVSTGRSRWPPYH